MNSARRRSTSRAAPGRELAELRARLAETEQALRAIRVGEVDAVVVPGDRGARVFTLEGAERAYRVLIESMNEGALTLGADQLILYSNRCFAEMIKCPLERVIGSPMRTFLSGEDRATLRPLLSRGARSGSKIQVLLHAADGSKVPAQVSIRPLATSGSDRAIIGLVVTDMTEARDSEERLRAMARRVVEAQEAERGRVALELHDHVTQLLCAILFRTQALAETASAHDGSIRGEATKLLGMVAEASDEVQRISFGLRPSVLDELGLVAVVRAITAEFAKRTKVSVALSCARVPVRLPADIELTLYRILQEALRNVEGHAHARRVEVRLATQGALVRLVIRDDGIGFDGNRHGVGRKGRGHLGLLSMRERATYVGGTLMVKAARGAGTEIEVRIPLPPRAAAAD